MQAKAVVVVEWVCGTLHTNTTGEKTTFRESGRGGVREGEVRKVGKGKKEEKKKGKQEEEEEEEKDVSLNRPKHTALACKSSKVSVYP